MPVAKVIYPTITPHYHALMLNHRLAALLVLLACVISPLTIHWITIPGAGWWRPYGAWLLVIIASWLWQRRRGRYER